MNSNNQESITIVTLNEIKNEFPEMAKTFDTSTRYIFQRYGQGWGLQNSDFFVVKKDSEIRSSLILITLPVHCGGIIIRVGGIACLRTKKEHRQKGYASKLLSSTVDYMKKRGIEIFVLFTEIQSFYFRFNFEPYSDFHYQTKVDEIRVEDKVSGVTSRNFNETDIFQVASLYDDYIRDYNISVVRSLNYWKWQLDWLEKHKFLGSKIKDWPAFLVAEENNQIVGYIRSKIGEGILVIYESIFAEGKSYCLQPLYAYLIVEAENKGIDKVNIYTPRDSILIEYFGQGAWIDSGQLLILNLGNTFFSEKIKEIPIFISPFDHF